MNSGRFLLKTTQWLIVVMTVYTIIGFLVIPPVAKRILSKQLSEQMKREVVINSILFNPYALSIYVNGFFIADRTIPEGLFSFDQLYLNLQMASIWEKGLILKEIKVYSPNIHVIRDKEGAYNFSDLVEAGEAKPAVESEPFKFSLNNIQLVNGGISFLDAPQNTNHTVRDITLKIPRLSNLPYFIDKYVQPVLQATVNGTPVSMGGNSKPFLDSHETIIDLDIKGIDLPHYLEYVPYTMTFKLLYGKIDANSRISYIQYKDRPANLSVTGDVSLHDLRIVDKDDQPLIHLPAFSLKTIELDVTDKMLSIGEVNSENGTIVVRRYEDGTLNMERPLPKLAAKLEEAAEGKEESPWVVQINKISLDGYTIKTEDHVPSTPVNLAATEINVSAENISTRKNSKGSLTYSLKFNETGSISAKSSFSINPVAADVALSIKGIEIVPLQAYITDKVNILLTDGAVSVDGNLSYDTSEDAGVTAQYKGNVSISKFASVDKVNTNDFLKWNSLYFSGINFNLDPLSVHIKDVSLTDFYSRLIINPDGSLNVQGIMKKEEVDAETSPADDGVEAKDVEQKPVRSTPIKIETVTLQAGKVNFSDRHIRPNYSANLLEIGGRVSGLSSEADSLADVDLRGKLENYAPLQIRGSINPLREDLYVDLKVDFNDMDLSPLTPYANKFIGYNIQKGALSLDLKYLIVKKKLDSTNSIFLDQFTLGERVESPDATKLPVKFAIALLKNRSGEINLDIPVSGELGDPEFSIAGIVIKMIVNLLVKAATSPFALLGALVGGGEELSYIDYDYASSLIKEQEKAKLDKLAKALSERPALKIDIEGYVDTDKDTEGLRQYAFNNKLKAQRLKEMVMTGQAVVPVDDITIEPEEYEKYLTLAYKEEQFPKPRNALGIPKTLPADEMEKLMLAHIEIKDDDLRLLASKRAFNVKDYLLASGEIDPGRVFLIEPESLQPEEKEKLKNSRVDFKLK